MSLSWPYRSRNSYCTILINKVKLLITCVYLAPNIDMEMFRHSLDILEKTLLAWDFNLCIGDFNLSIIDSDSMTCKNNAKGSLFLKLCLVKFVKKSLLNVLDLVLSNKIDFISELLHNAPFGTSDHDSIDIIASVTKDTVINIKFYL